MSQKVKKENPSNEEIDEKDKNKTQETKAKIGSDENVVIKPVLNEDKGEQKNNEEPQLDHLLSNLSVNQQVNQPPDGKSDPSVEPPVEQPIEQPVDNNNFRCWLNTREGWCRFEYLRIVKNKTVYAVNKENNTKKLFGVGDTITLRNQGDRYAGIAVDGGSALTSIYLTSPSFKRRITPFSFTIGADGLSESNEHFDVDPKTLSTRNCHPNYYHWDECTLVA